ncbi:MFS transporter [Lysinibacillus sp. NPDC056959]|uniref:MFS transporter n=1 Tax=Lysinibacillus sp. NPDC056959 TaxID=3345981 RepID=UPI003629F3F5
MTKDKNKVRLLIASDSFSKLGDMAEGIALATFVFTITQSGFLFGLFLFLRFVPELIIGPFSGYLADKVSRRTITVSVNLILAFMSILLLISHESYTIILIIATIASFIKMLFRPAFLSSIPLIVEEKELPNINRWFGFFGGFARVIGATIAAYGIFLNNISLIFSLNAISFLVFALVCWFVIPNKKRLISQDNEEESSTLIEALKFMWQSKKIFGLVMGSTLLWGCLALSDTLLIPTLGAAKDGGEDFYGIYRILSAVGMMIGSYFSYKWYKLFFDEGKHLVGFFIPIIIMCISTLLIPLSPFFWGYILYLLIWISKDLPANLLDVELQTVPNHIRGKIISLADAIDGILFSLITLVLPILTEFYDPGLILILVPIPFLLLTILLLINSVIQQYNKNSKSNSYI